MLRTLLETRRVAQRLRGGATLSVVMHAGVIAAVAAATATAGPHVERPHPQPSVVFTAPPPHPMPPEHGGASAPAPVIGVLPRAPVFTISVDVPDHLPDPGPIAADPSPWPTPATTPRDPGGTTAPGAGSGIWTDRTVEQPVLPLGDAPRPRYPDLLRSAGVAGDVLVQFVVDTTGRVEPGSVRVLRATHPLFADAVTSVMPLARFVPAEAQGRRVRQLVQQPFSFAIAR